MHLPPSVAARSASPAALIVAAAHQYLGRCVLETDVFLYSFMGKVLEFSTTEGHIATHDFFWHSMSFTNAFLVCDDSIGCLVWKL